MKDYGQLWYQEGVLVWRILSKLSECEDTRLVLEW
jgi:hypothetical protein